MAFDLRLSIGLLLLFCGAVLFLHGVVVGTLVLGININLWWGAVLVVCGGLMAYFGWRASRRRSLRHKSSAVGCFG